MHKKDFSLLFEVKKANPNGDPLNGNIPRLDMQGKGEVSDVAIKRKIRNRLQDMGLDIYVQSNGRETDDYRNLQDRFYGTEGIKEIEKGLKASTPTLDALEQAGTALKKKYIDVRAFGQVVAFDSISKGIQGAVSIGQAVSINPVEWSTEKITKSVNSTNKPGKGSDTMGDKHRVEYGLYRMDGSINAKLAEKNGLTEEDVSYIKQALLTLFENDESSARPAGSINVLKLYWWEHDSELGNCSPHKSYNSLVINSLNDNPQSVEDYEFTLLSNANVPEVEEIEGF